MNYRHRGNVTISRRMLLQGGSSVLLGAVLQSRSALAIELLSPATSCPREAVTATLSRYMSAAGDRALPPEVIEATKEHILDTVAAMISGAHLPPARVALRFARENALDHANTIVGSKITCAPMEAALANGMLAQSDETDDSHAPSHSHPGCAVVPAAMAIGEHLGISGTRFVRAVALGYDVGPRITMALGGLPYQIKTHRSTHSIANTFAASAAAGCAASFNPQQMRWVLDYAAQQASGIAAWQRDTEHVEKSLVFGGMPARNGVSTALLISAGASGVDNIFFGADNFLAAFAPDADVCLLVDQLGSRFEVARTNIKKWTVGSPIQAPLDALKSLIESRSLRADQVKEVLVSMATSEAKTVDNRSMPDISLQQMMAVMLIDGTVSFQAAHEQARMSDPATVAERNKVKLISDQELENLYPVRAAIVEVVLTNGTRLTKRVDAVRGTQQNPMTRDEVVEKAKDLMGPSLGASHARLVIDAVLHMEAIGSLRTFGEMLRVS